MILDWVGVPVYANPALSNNSVNTGLPLIELQTGPTDQAVLLEVSFMNPLRSGTAGSFHTIGLGAPAASGVGQLPVSLTRETSWLSNSLPGINLYSQWRTPPTAPTSFLRRLTLQANGSSNRYRQRFTFPNGFKMGPSTSLVLWSLLTPGGNNQFLDVQALLDG